MGNRTPRPKLPTNKQSKLRRLFKRVSRAIRALQKAKHEQLR
jgi:hypothetical protein